MPETNEHLTLHGISKRFGGVTALRDVSLSIERGSIHALVGENGAGKSTLGKLVAGYYAPDAGELTIDGQPVKFRSTRDALLAGITIVGQERSILPRRSVIDNVFLGRESRSAGLIHQRAMTKRYSKLCRATGFDLPGNAKVGSLRVSEQLQVEILRALVRDARLLIMDEVTAALTAAESERLFSVIRSLRREGRTVIYISHFLGEVLALADTVTVLRDGSLIRTGATATETPASLVTAMLGRALELTFPEKVYPSEDAPTVLSVRGLSRVGVLDDVSLEVRAGEIVGLAGLIGSGRTELARAVFGADRRDSGEIEIAGRSTTVRHPRDAIKAGLALVPESRKEQGLLMRSSIIENTSLVHLGEVARLGVLRFGRERRQVVDLVSRLDVRASGPRALIDTLSGGNQQKVLFGKWLFRTPRVLIADEPTRGVDVGAKHAIYELITGLAAEGMGVLLISSELEEVLGLAHRVLVMRFGSLVAEFDSRSAAADDIMRAAFAADADVGQAA
jgi:ribose transport system ATP-binding protein